MLITHRLSTLLLLASIGMSLSEYSYDITLIKDLLADYDWKLRPLGKDSMKRKGGPLMINVNILLRTISKIDDVNMEFSTQFTFRQSWNDHRLAYGKTVSSELPDFDSDFAQIFDDKKTPEFIVLTPSEGPHSEMIWIPDTFFQNEKSAHKHTIDKPNILIRIYPNGDVLYSVRLSLVLSCPMSLAYYPMDTQDCFIDFSSYAYTTDDIQYQWTNETPVQLKDTVKTSLPTFELGPVLTKSCVSNTSTGVYSCLRVHLHFQRMFSYYLLQLYIPSFMLVIVSWVSFWVDKSSVPARVTLGVTTLLTITTQASGINAKLPPVSYTKAIDVWIGVCLAFVFGALLEYALVNYADEGFMTRRHYKGTANRERTFSEVAAASEVSPLFLNCSAAFETPPVPANHKRLDITLTGSYGCDHTKPPPRFRQSSSYPWVEDGEAAKNANIPQSHHHSQSQACFTEAHVIGMQPYSVVTVPASSDCPDCYSAPCDLPIRSYADRRLRASGRWKRLHAPVYNRIGSWVRSLYNEADRAKKIDVISRVVFPFFFLCFNCIYWIVY